ncbi:MAG TPA: CapA family protein [Spirochaetota bacterium]|nr:CapA family protein [Spirochaetota bacterium]HPC41325.1 CapA family protein [Spirochaetota bacterium]HPL15420.1 CapA family protein [Spirochaetota bacterium]HQF09744.1 CapA family protein [Spirochaetota bacterium]HQH98893.1 CapA family protein [Spirochaetota bacterium]
MKKILIMSIAASVLTLLALGCNQAPVEDVITELAKKNSKAPANNGADDGGYGTVIPDDGNGPGTVTPPPPPNPVVLKLVFAGDTILGGKVKDAVISYGAGSYQYPFQYAAPYLKTADVAFLNLESIITDQGSASGDSSLRADPAAISGLTYAGIDIVSVANDHAFDYGRAGFDSSLRNLSGAGIAYVGGGSFEESYTAKIIEVKGCKIAYLAFTNLGDEYSVRTQKNDPSQGLTARTGVAWFYTKYVGPAIISAKKLADIVVVSLHMGKVGAPLPNLYQDKYSHYCIDQGASLVIGHHAGVIQPVMAYMKGYIANSLGNFVNYPDNDAAKKGMILEVTVTDKKITKVNRVYVQINSNYQPVVTY